MIAGTRGSRLALAQMNLFANAMAEHSVILKIRVIRTSGDMDLLSDLKDIGGYGAFVRELDNAILAKEIDVSVNSMKDIPVMVNPEISIGAVLQRASCEDVIIPMSIDELPYGAVVGSSSVRRTAILRNMRPDLDIRGLRGNIDTRLNKLGKGEYDAIILSKAGLDRLGIKSEMHILDISEFVPAPGQGAIAIACRSSDTETMELLNKVDDFGARTETEAERMIMRIMGGICSSPIGINAKTEVGGLRIRAVFLDSAGIRRYDSVIPMEYTLGDLQEVANVLKDERR